MIFICLTPGPEGEHLKIIELESPPLGAGGGGLIFRSRLKILTLSFMLSHFRFKIYSIEG